MGNNLTWRNNSSLNPNPPKLCPDEDRLRKLYIKEKKGSHKIAKEFGVTQRLVMIWLRRAGIKTRSYAQASKISLNGYKQEEQHLNWVGENVGYSALHVWVRKHKGTPKKCEQCGTIKKRKYEWHNTNKEYKRNLNDWVRVCVPCHRKLEKKL